MEIICNNRKGGGILKNISRVQGLVGECEKTKTKQKTWSLRGEEIGRGLGVVGGVMQRGWRGAVGADATALGIEMMVSQVYASVRAPQTEQFKCLLLLYAHGISMKLKK